MNKKQLDRLETYLEQFIEGAFSNLFGRRIRAQDVALRLARAMEDASLPPSSDDPRRISPDQFIIHVNPKVQAYLLSEYPELLATLSVHLLELATQSGYKLTNTPAVKLLADPKIDTGTVIVHADYVSRDTSSTAAMKPIALPDMKKPQNPQLIINDSRVVDILYDMVNIGRHPDNHIVIDDPSVSRHHLQLRLRYGAYYLFDVRSRTGTIVNGVPLKEHRLQSGDIIRLGNTQIVYLQDDEEEEEFDGSATAGFDPI